MPSGEGTTAALQFSIGHTATGWPKKAGNAKSATGTGTTSRAGNTFLGKDDKSKAKLCN